MHYNGPLVERSPEKAGVGGSSPSLATTFSIAYSRSKIQFHSVSFQNFGPPGFASGMNCIYGDGVKASPYHSSGEAGTTVSASPDSVSLRGSHEKGSNLRSRLYREQIQEGRRSRFYSEPRGPGATSSGPGHPAWLAIPPALLRPCQWCHRKAPWPRCSHG